MIENDKVVDNDNVIIIILLRARNMTRTGIIWSCIRLMNLKRDCESWLCVLCVPHDLDHTHAKWIRPFFFRVVNGGGEDKQIFTCPQH